MLHMLDFFYFEEHLVIVSELLGDNLYEFSKAVKEAGHPKYFTLPRLCKIARQCLEVTVRFPRPSLARWYDNAVDLLLFQQWTNCCVSCVPAYTAVGILSCQQ